MRVEGLGFRGVFVWGGFGGLGFGVWGFEYKVSGFRFRVSVLGFGVQKFEFLGSQLEVEGSWFEVSRRGAGRFPTHATVKFSSVSACV